MLPSAHTVAQLVATAARAPSSHNTQPWRFHVEDQRVELRLDPAHRLPVNDPADRELVISCGAALLTLRVAAAAADLAARVEVMPEEGPTQLLARVTLTAGGGEPRLAALGAAVDVRRTERGPFQDEPLPAGLLDRMTAAALDEGVTLHPVDQAARRLVAGLVAQGDRVQFRDPAWRRELASWMHPASAGDGLRTSAVTRPVARAVVTHVDLGGPTSHRDADLVWGAPELVVLTTGSDNPDDWLRAGQGLQRALLSAAAEGVSAGFLNQPCQVGGALRERLGLAVGSRDVPQLLLRLGRPRKPLTATPRRPLTSILEPDPGEATDPT